MTCFRNQAQKDFSLDRPGKPIKKIWCHALGEWLDLDYVISAHLVAKSLATEELSYAFGVEELSLTDLAFDMSTKISLIN